MTEFKVLSVLYCYVTKGVLKIHRPVYYKVWISDKLYQLKKWQKYGKIIWKENNVIWRLTGVLKIENSLNKQRGHSKIESKKNFLRGRSKSISKRTLFSFFLFC